MFPLKPPQCLDFTETLASEANSSGQPVFTGLFVSVTADSLSLLKRLCMLLFWLKPAVKCLLRTHKQVILTLQSRHSDARWSETAGEATWRLTNPGPIGAQHREELRYISTTMPAGKLCVCVCRQHVKEITLYVGCASVAFSVTILANYNRVIFFRIVSWIIWSFFKMSCHNKVQHIFPEPKLAKMFNLHRRLSNTFSICSTF